MYTDIHTHTSMRAITYWLSLGMIFIIPWENVVHLEGVGTLARATGILVAGFWILTVLVTGSFRRLHAFHVVAMLFVLWNGISVAWSLETEVTLILTITYFQLFVMVLILWDIYTTPASVRAAMQVYVLGAFVTIASILSNYLFGGEELRRYTASGFGENRVGLILALGMPIAWYLALFEEYRLRHYWLRLLNFAYIPGAFTGIMLTGSRAAILGMVPLSLFMIATLGKIKFYQRMLLLTLVIGALIALIPVIPESTFNRIAATRSEATGGGTSDRLPIWYEGARIFADNPLLGVGSGAFRSAATETRKSAHNVALALLAEIGVVGFGLFVAILVIAAYQVRFLSKTVAWLWLTVFSMWFLSALTHSWQYLKPTWLFLGLAMCMVGAYARRSAAASTAGLPVNLHVPSAHARKNSAFPLKKSN